MEALEPIEVQRARCKRYRDLLRNLARIHIEIDARKRRVGADEPDWFFRMRKVCLHAVAITKCEVCGDGVHVMATELRAAYEQMDAVWKCLPDEFRFKEDGSWWAKEARGGLAVYSHPTSLGFGLTVGVGRFRRCRRTRGLRAALIVAGPTSVRVWAGTRLSGAGTRRQRRTSNLVWNRYWPKCISDCCGAWKPRRLLKRSRWGLRTTSANPRPLSVFAACVEASRKLSSTDTLRRCSVPC